MNKICQYSGCGLKHYSKGFCLKHSARLRRHGTVELIPLKGPEEKFMNEREIDSNGCWLWTGHIRHDGYGICCALGKRFAVHRVSFKHFFGEIPEGMHVCHKCDVRNCFNPEHLFLGDDFDNMGDAAKKGRIKSGENHYRAKFKNSDIPVVISMHKSGEKIVDIAKKFGCHRETVAAIVKKKRWTHAISGV